MQGPAGISASASRFATRPIVTGGDVVPAPRLGVSIAVVNWNTRDLVLRLIESLGESELSVGRFCEVLVVDNASADGSADAIRTRFPAVKVLAQERNLGFAAAVNLALQAASQPLVLMINPDTVVGPDTVEALCVYAEENPTVAAIGPRIVDGAGAAAVSHWRSPSLRGLAWSSIGLTRLAEDRRPGEVAGDVDCVSGCAVLMRREDVLRAGGLDDAFFMYFEETDLFRRLRASGARVHYAPVTTVLHEGAGASRKVPARTFLEFRRSCILYHRKHGGAFSAAGARALLALGHAMRLAPLCAASVLPGRLGAHARGRRSLHAKALWWLLTARGLVPGRGAYAGD